MTVFVEAGRDDVLRPHLLDRLQRFAVTTTRPIAFIGVLGMLIASGATVVDVLARWLFDSGVIALNELFAMIFALAVAACIPSGTAEGVGITIDVLEGALTRRVAAWLRAIGSLLLLLFFVLLTWRMGVFASTLAAEGRTTVILGVPQAPFIWATTVLLAIATAVQAIVAANMVRRSSALPAGEAWNAASIVAVSLLGLLTAFVLYGFYDFATLARWGQDNPSGAILIALGLMWIALLGLIPLAAVMGLLGITGTALFIGFPPSFSTLAAEAAGFLTNYNMAALPLFLMMGSFAAVAGIADDVYRLAQAVLGRFRGGLAMATIGGCAGFGAVTGSSLATVATFGRVSLPQMRARAYAPEFAAGCVAAGGTLGALIPPSAPLIIFALLTEASIGQLFVAAVVPGLIATALYLAMVAAIVHWRPQLAPPAERPQRGDLTAALRRCGGVILLFGCVIGGMYSGVFTATEAAAIGAFIAFVIAVMRGKLRGGNFWTVMAETTTSTALIYTIIFGVLTFSFCIGISALPDRAMALIGGLNLPPLVVIALVMVLFLFLGCIMDSFTVMIITVPILTPVIEHMGYDIIWWGIINLVVVEIGLITPPFGLHLFVLKSMLRDLPLERLYKGVLPFCCADFFKILLLILFPILVLWLPSTMMR